MKVSIKGFITCKSAEQYIDCADNYATNKTNHKFSISDGVSKSFFPKIWSEILVSQFVEQTSLDESELMKLCQDEWQKRIDEIISSPETKWFTKSQYNRKDPALATFVGLQFFEKKKSWVASAIGDSFLFFIAKEYKDYQKELLKLSSKTEPITFDNFPDYLSSIGNLHNGERKVNNGEIKNGTFYLMTDALAEWFLKEGENAIGKIEVWQSQSDFEKYVDLTRGSDNLTNDDSAILIIDISEADKDGITYTKINITDLKDLIDKQEAEITKANQEEESKANEKEIAGQKTAQINSNGDEDNTDYEKASYEEYSLESKEVGESKTGVISKDIGENEVVSCSKEKPKPVEEKVLNETNTSIESSSEQVNAENIEKTSEDEYGLEVEILQHTKEENMSETETEKKGTKQENVVKEYDKGHPKVDLKTKNIVEKF